MSRSRTWLLSATLGCGPGLPGGEPIGSTVAAGSEASDDSTPPVTTAPPDGTTTAAQTSTTDPSDPSSSSSSASSSSTDASLTTGGPCNATDPAQLEACTEALQDEGCGDDAACLCDACLCEYRACLMDEGCAAIRQCTRETGCVGIDCLEPRNCGGVIDKHGGVAGPSSMLALELNGCNHDREAPPSHAPKSSPCPCRYPLC